MNIAFRNRYVIEKVFFRHAVIRFRMIGWHAALIAPIKMYFFPWNFAGFESNFYGSYFEEARVAAGFNNGVDIYNLYPLLVHVNLFGGGYANQVAAILNRFA